MPVGKSESANATFVIKRGLTVIGRVSDAHGTPIVGAVVKEFQTSGQRKLVTATDASGRFLLLGLSEEYGPQAEIAVEARGLASQWRRVDLRAPTNIVDFVLAKGNVFRGHVVDDTGQRLIGVACRTDSDNQGRRPFEWFTHTDPEGRFEWDSAPNEPGIFWFETTGYRPIRNLQLSADGSDHEIKLVRNAK